MTKTKPTHFCSTTDIYRVVDPTGRWTSTTVSNTLTDVEEDIYLESGKPIQAMWSPIEELDSVVQRRYYVGEEDICRIDRAFYGTATKVEIFEGAHFKVSTPYGMVELLPVASSGLTYDVDREVEIHYVPKIYKKIAIYKTAKKLLEQMDTTSGGAVSKELQVIKDALKEHEDILKNRVALQISSDTIGYDRNYLKTRRFVLQDYWRNSYIGSTIAL